MNHIPFWRKERCLEKKVFFSHPKGDKNKKGSPLRPQYLVNLKSNTMKNTHANIEIIYDTRKFFLAKDLSFNIF